MRAFSLTVFALALAPAPLLAQDSLSPAWSQTKTRITFPGGKISVPIVPGGLVLEETMEASGKGEGIDNVVKYRVPGEDIWASVYVYMPGLPDTGLTQFATGTAISARATGPRSSAVAVAAGGVQGAALRESWSGYLDKYYSVAAYAKVGMWQVKLRVSGAEADRVKVDAAMDTLLAEVAFHESPVSAARTLHVEPCQAGEGEVAAAKVAQNPIDLGAFIALASQPTIDAETDQEVGLPFFDRIGTRFCAMPVRKNETYPMLFARDAPATDRIASSRLLFVQTDAGNVLEVVRLSDNVHQLLHHKIGVTYIMGAYDGVPSEAQIRAILSGADKEGGRYRADMQLRLGRAVKMTIIADRPAQPGN